MRITEGAVATENEQAGQPVSAVSAVLTGPAAQIQRTLEVSYNLTTTVNGLLAFVAGIDKKLDQIQKRMENLMGTVNSGLANIQKSEGNTAAIASSLLVALQGVAESQAVAIEMLKKIVDETEDPQVQAVADKLDADNAKIQGAVNALEALKVQLDEAEKPVAPPPVVVAGPAQPGQNVNSPAPEVSNPQG